MVMTGLFLFSQVHANTSSCRRKFIDKIVSSILPVQLMSRWGQFMDDTTQTEEGGDDDRDNDHRWTTDKKMFKESIKQSKKRK